MVFVFFFNILNVSEEMQHSENILKPILMYKGFSRVSIFSFVTIFKLHAE